MRTRGRYTSLAAFFAGERVTQLAFSQRIGVVPSYVSMLLAGERQPSLALAVRIAEAARIPVESLLQRPRGGIEHQTANGEG